MSKTTPKVGELKRQVIDALSPCFKKLGLVRASDEVYWSNLGDCARLVQIASLTARNAAYFKSTTASFSVEFGGLYPPLDWCKNEKDFPSTQFCPVRGNLLRGYPQRAPDEDLPAVEHERRDIWWVDQSGTDLSKVIADAVRAVEDELSTCLDKLTRPNEIRARQRSFSAWLTNREPPRVTWFLVPKVIKNL